MEDTTLPKQYWTHYAHLNDTTVEVGDVIPAQYIIGHVGATGSVSSAHLHFEIVRELRNYTAYTLNTQGEPLSVAEMQRYYTDPGAYLHRTGVVTPMTYTHLGYGWLSVIGQVGGVDQYHPGYDMNRGSSNDDLYDPVYATEPGTVVYHGNDNGWGNHIWIEHTQTTSNKYTMLEQEGRELVFYKKDSNTEAQYWVLNHNTPPSKRTVKQDQVAWVRGALFTKQRQISSPKELDGFADKGDFTPNKLARNKPELFF